MTPLRTNSLTIRGRSFTVSELSAKAMRDVRKIMDKEPHRLDLYIASISLVEPKMTEAELGEEANVFAKGISAEAMRLSAEDDSNPKPEAPATSA